MTPESFYIYGRHPVREALRTGAPVQKLYLHYGTRYREELERLARQRGIPVTVVDAARFAELARSAGATDVAQTQGVVALCAPTRLWKLEELVGSAPQPDALLVALDGIEDPQNLGAIARSAEAAGCAGLLLPRHHGTPITPAALKASAGALVRLPVTVVANLAQALRWLRDRGFWIVGTAADGERLYWEPLPVLPIVLVIGGEHRGMRPSIRKLCDWVVRIPLRGAVESLNASAAAAVVLFELRRQRSMEVPLATSPEHVSN
jgi:23S rRNA (guanosine2251-2'-O)-methyltransferase